MKKLIITAVIAVAAASIASANVLDLSYSVSNGGGGMYDYSFTLSVDASTSVGSGQGWSWIVFGDEASAASPLGDFTLTSATPAPFGVLSFSGGGHNGPTWLEDASNNIVYWTPTNNTQTLTWTGTSSSNLGQGQLLYSELLPTGGAAQDNYAVATLQSVPAPSGAIALTIGLAGLAFLKYRNNR